MVPVHFHMNGNKLKQMSKDKIIEKGKMYLKQHWRDIEQLIIKNSIKNSVKNTI